MPRDASGNYTLPAGNPVSDGTIIATTWANPTMSDIGSEITNSLDRNGRGGMLVPFQNVDGTVIAPGITFTNEPASGLYRAAANDVRMSIAGENTTRWVNDTGTPAGEQQPFEIWDGAMWQKGIYAGGNVTFGLITQIANNARIKQFKNNDAPDEGFWEFGTFSAEWKLRTRTDADSIGKDAFKALRTGTAINEMIYGNSADNPVHTFFGAISSGSQISTTSNSSSFGRLLIDSTTPIINFYDSNGGVDAKRSRITANNTGITIQSRNDADNVARDIFKATRSAENITSIVYGNSVNSPSHTFHGNITSTGFLDLATSEKLRVTDATAQFGGGAAYTLALRTSNQLLAIQGDSNTANGAGLWLFGSTHAGTPNNLLFKSGGNTIGQYNSASGVWSYNGRLQAVGNSEPFGLSASFSSGGSPVYFGALDNTGNIARISTGGGTPIANLAAGTNTFFGNVVVNGEITGLASDARLKENIASIHYPLELIKQLNGVTHDWVDNIEEIGFKPRNKTNDISLIAQEVERVVPQAVAETGIEDYKTIQYEKLVPLLVECIKELEERVDTLEGMLVP